MSPLGFFLSGIANGIAITTVVLLGYRSFSKRCPPTPGESFGFIFVGQGTFEMAKTIVQGSTHTATAVFTDANGVTRPLHSIPAWSASPDGLVTLAPAEDGMTCGITAGSTDGDVTLTVTAEGDPSPGVNTITGTFDLSVVDPEDTQVTITVD